EPVSTPALAADPVMHEEKAGRIVFLLDGEESLIVGTPVSALPVAEKVVAFRHIRSGVLSKAAKFRHRPADRIGVPARDCKIRMMAGDGGECGRSLAAGNRQRKRVDDI